MRNVPEKELQVNLDSILTRAERAHRDFPAWKTVCCACWD